MSETNASSVTSEIAGQDVTLARKFVPGHVLTENQARVLDAAYLRQYTNNMNANNKSRLEAKPEAKPALTVDEIVAAWADYEPNVGGGPRQTSMEKIKADAAWRMWTALVAEHNTSVSNGGAPVIAKAGTKQVPSLKPVRGADGKVSVTVGEQRDRLTARILTMPEYADKVQTHIDAILAERGKDKPEAASASDTVSLDDLF